MRYQAALYPECSVAEAVGLAWPSSRDKRVAAPFGLDVDIKV